MADILIIGVIGLIVGFAGGYIHKQKKKGKACVGCPYGGECPSRGKKDACCGK